ncbi:hypothetical protein BJ944DRAFT_274277 [Cunninghamella echinulata]|nr:hypothetical protein BJ944DRAFT_274277 [Cunninghamella echinulata]
MMIEKNVNRMSIEHILCSPLYGLPSPTSSYHSSEDEDEEYYEEETNDNNKQQSYQSILHYHHHDQQQHKGKSYSSSPTTPIQRIPWTPSEDKLLKQGYEQGLSWAMIASTYLPHRSRGCCWGRFKTLKNKKLLTVRRKIRAKERPWKSFNPCNIQH